jgi:hypothetical protein
MTNKDKVLAVYPRAWKGRNGDIWSMPLGCERHFLGNSWADAAWNASRSTFAWPEKSVSEYEIAWMLNHYMIDTLNYRMAKEFNAYRRERERLERGK